MARRRGSAGLAVHDGKFYLVGGNTIGHNGGFVPFFDEFDPETGTWTSLPDAPRARDHFQAAVVGDKLYAASGRLTGGDGGTFAPLIPEVDVYDFTTGTWSTLPATSNIPTPRAATASAIFQDRILVMGGEGGGQAFDTVEALDPVSETWEPVASMNHARHGFGAIASGNGVYVVTGSPQQGGGNQKNMEVFNANEPAGSPSVAGLLSTPASVNVEAGTPAAVGLDHVGGNEGIFVQSLTLSGPDAADFALTSPGDAFLLPVAGTRAVGIEYLGSAETASASLEIAYSGSELATVDLVAVPEPGLVLGIACGAFGLSVLSRRGRRRGPQLR